MSLPQYIGTKLGTRMWTVRTKTINNIETLALCPIVTPEHGVDEKYQWMPLQPIVAKDRHTPIFCFKELSQCKQYRPDVNGRKILIKGATEGSTIPGIIGRISLWGWIHEHTLGYHSEFAYPYEFYLPEDADMYYYGLVYRLAATYKVRVIEVKRKALHEAIWGKEE